MTLPEKFKQITCFVLDVDGVLTDGTIYIFESGEQVRRMSIKDGFALQLAIKKGYEVLVISGSNAPAVSERLKRLGIENVFMGVLDKRTLLLQLMKERNIAKEQLLYMGDDLPDYIGMMEAGLACAPLDAVSEIKRAAHYISSFEGGRGCVREVIEKVLKLNDHWETDTLTASR